MARAACPFGLASLVALGLLCIGARAAYTPLFSCPPFAADSKAALLGSVKCAAPDDAATDAAAFALPRIAGAPAGAKVVTVLSYGRQVVAGTNAFVTFVYADAAGAMGVAQAQVYTDLAGKRSLSKGATVPAPALAANAAARSAAAPQFSCAGAGAGGAPAAGGVTCRPGGPDASAKKAAEFALSQINAAGAFASGPAALVAAVPPYGRQVVAGSNAFVTFVVSTPDGAAGVVQAAVFTDLSQKQSLTKWSLLSTAAPPAGAAKPAAAKQAPARGAKPLFTCPEREMPGGLFCKPADAQATRAAEFALKQINAGGSVASGPLKLQSVGTYATQVVAGTNYYVEFTAKDAAGATHKLQAQVFQALPVYGGGMELSEYTLL